jgi:methylthioribose-1-phosphate isomerase
MKTPLLMDLENNVFLEDGKLVVIDRRRLPADIIRIVCRDDRDVAAAIVDMTVQGAGDIAITAGFGLYLAAVKAEKEAPHNIDTALREASDRLCATRPTGFHLAALQKKILDNVRSGPADKKYSETILDYLRLVLAKQKAVSQDTGRHAERLLASGDRILTHCFAGAGLLYMLRFAMENRKDIRVICTETRPYLQGARLTAWSISTMGIDTTLITDNMAAHCMSKEMIDKVFTAADRIAMDGVAANKVGTLQLAICAKFYGIPFYILAYGGQDRNTVRGSEIPIEERNPREVLEFRGIPTSGPDVKAYYPSFDLTPPDLITAMITSRGIRSSEGT